MSDTATFTAPTDAAAPVSARLNATGLGVTVDGARLLDGVDFTARPGELHALLGPNGAGKSTLLGALAGDVRPSAGGVSLDGRPLGDWKLRELARERAVLLQQHDVYFPFTVRQVVEMGRSPWQGTAAEDDDERLVAEAMALCDIEALAGRTVPSLSGGERARAALARVLAQGASLLMLDEPTAALDLKHQEDVLRLVRERATSGATVIVVVHDLSLAAAYADRVTLLQHGRVVATGTPRDVLTAERIGEVYGQAVEVFEHPRTGAPLIVPLR
ncbi:heme ABC transporter ATP-binding protein [Microterricola viridarii]|uniref:Iron complex transport system ATP-binding protein n=1 Tax=Microterricola viridarii TaxID=412690 RepID=A0A1H1NTJ2_9MICO|nr:heme ABC transporter ATP-binding protein [Microterricola viridarii]SDS02301.1 iron complex transport system ATP-binding protein [Microterricola viridarii]